MALTSIRVTEVATEVAEVARETRNLLARIHQLLEYNSDQAIDWAAGSKPAYINEDQAGNLDGFAFARGNVANAIGSLDWVRKLLTNQTMTGSQGDHLGNLNVIAKPK